jgi:hypothetical protein
MAYPATIETFTPVDDGDTIIKNMFNPSYSVIEELEAIVGVNGSAVESLKYKCDNFFIKTGNINYMWFWMATPPTGWTYYGLSDNVLAIKGGAYGASGQAVVGSWSQPGHVLTVNEMPVHNHNLVGGVGMALGTYFTRASETYAATYTDMGNKGGGASHNHGSAYRPYAAVGLIAKYTGA